VIHALNQAGVLVDYEPQNPDCSPAALADLNNDGCVDWSDFAELMAEIRTRSNDLNYDLNGDGRLWILPTPALGHGIHDSQRFPLPTREPLQSDAV
jgi:hypothetical protein